MPSVQYCPCEAWEKKLGQKPKSEQKEIELSYCQHNPFDLSSKKENFEIKERQNWMENDRVMPI